METVAEGHVLAEKTGLGVTNLQKLLTVLFPIGPLMIYSNRMSTGGYCRNQVRSESNISAQDREF